MKRIKIIAITSALLLCGGVFTKVNMNSVALLSGNIGALTNGDDFVYIGEEASDDWIKGLRLTEIYRKGGGSRGMGGGTGGVERSGSSYDSVILCCVRTNKDSDYCNPARDDDRC